MSSIILHFLKNFLLQFQDPVLDIFINMSKHLSLSVYLTDSIPVHHIPAIVYTLYCICINTYILLSRSWPIDIFGNVYR